MGHEMSISNWVIIDTKVEPERLDLTNHHVLRLLLLHAYDEITHNSVADLPGMSADSDRYVCPCRYLPV
jgi:hypothetical protein